MISPADNPSHHSSFLLMPSRFLAALPPSGTWPPPGEQHVISGICWFLCDPIKGLTYALVRPRGFGGWESGEWGRARIHLHCSMRVPPVARDVAEGGR